MPFLRLMLEVSESANCRLLVADPPDVGAGTPAYRCFANRANNPTMLACGALAETLPATGRAQG
jgi:hypothetical protein